LPMAVLGVRYNERRPAACTAAHRPVAEKADRRRAGPSGRCRAWTECARAGSELRAGAIPVWRADCTICAARREISSRYLNRLQAWDPQIRRGTRACRGPDAARAHGPTDAAPSQASMLVALERRVVHSGNTTPADHASEAAVDGATRPWRPGDMLHESCQAGGKATRPQERIVRRRARCLLLSHEEFSCRAYSQRGWAEPNFRLNRPHNASCGRKVTPENGEGRRAVRPMSDMS